MKKIISLILIISITFIIACDNAPAGDSGNDGDQAAEKVATPLLSIDLSDYYTEQIVTIVSPTEGASIYYSFDGSEPKPNWVGTMLYTDPITVPVDAVLKARAAKNGMEWSDVVTSQYAVAPVLEQVKKPAFSIDLSLYSTVQSLEMTCDTAGATIIYTLDGTEPSDTNGFTYPSSSITVPLNSTLKAVAVKDGMLDSEINISEYNNPDWRLKLFGGAGSNHVFIFCMTTDDSGNIYVAGSLNIETGSANYADMNPGTAADPVYSASEKGSFVTRINTDGTYGWTKLISGLPYAITTDSSSNIFVTGFFYDNTVFGPSGSDPIQVNGASDLFVTKINSDSTYSWTKTFGGDNSSIFREETRGIATDSSGNVYIIGKFNNTTDFDPGPGEYNLSVEYSPDGEVTGHENNAFLLKLDNNGLFQWAMNIGRGGQSAGWDVAIDSNNDIYVAGYFRCRVDFDPTGGEYFATSNYFDDLFITKINADLTYAWAVAFGNTTDDVRINSIAIDNSNGVYACGNYGGTCNFNRTSGEDYKTAIAYKEGFIMKVNKDSSYCWTRTTSYMNDMPCRLFKINFSSSNNVYVAGYAESIYTYPMVISYDPDGNMNYHYEYEIVTLTPWPVKDNRAYGIASYNGNAYLAGSFNCEINFSDDSGNENKMPLGTFGMSATGFLKRIEE